MAAQKTKRSAMEEDDGYTVASVMVPDVPKSSMLDLAIKQGPNAVKYFFHTGMPFIAKKDDAARSTVAAGSITSRAPALPPLQPRAGFLDDVEPVMVVADVPADTDMIHVLPVGEREVRVVERARVTTQVIPSSPETAYVTRDDAERWRFNVSDTSDLAVRPLEEEMDIEAMKRILDDTADQTRAQFDADYRDTLHLRGYVCQEFLIPKHVSTEGAKPPSVSVVLQNGTHMRAVADYLHSKYGFVVVQYSRRRSSKVQHFRRYKFDCAHPDSRIRAKIPDTLEREIGGIRADAEKIRTYSAERDDVEPMPCTIAQVLLEHERVKSFVYMGAVVAQLALPDGIPEAGKAPPSGESIDILRFHTRCLRMAGEPLASYAAAVARVTHNMPWEDLKFTRGPPPVTPSLLFDAHYWLDFAHRGSCPVEPRFCEVVKMHFLLHYGCIVRRFNQYNHTNKLTKRSFVSDHFRRVWNNKVSESEILESEKASREEAVPLPRPNGSTRGTVLSAASLGSGGAGAGAGAASVIEPSVVSEGESLVQSTRIPTPILFPNRSDRSIVFDKGLM